MTETVEPAATAQPAGRGRRTPVIVGASVLTVGVLAAGAYAVSSVLGGGAAAEQALPGNALASVSIDLDPGAKQKVAAVRTLRKFPSLRKEIGGSDVDLREKLYDALLAGDDDCPVSYRDDVAPWIGKNAAVAAVPFGSGIEEVSPVVALAVDDEDAARAGLKKLAACDTAKGSAFVVTDGFALLGDTQAHVRAAAKRAKTSSLADDATYQKWTDRAGDRGIVNFYVAPKAGDLLADGVDDLAGGGLGDTGGRGDIKGFGLAGSFNGTTGPDDGVLAEPTLAASSSSDPDLERTLASFTGAAGALRFADAGVELSAVGGGLGTGGAGRVDDLLASIPKDTAALIGLAVPGDLAERLTTQLDDLGSGFGLSTRSLEQQTGLQLPEDLKALLGSGVGLALRDADIDPATVTGPGDVPAGLVVRGDADDITAAAAGIARAQGVSLADLGLTLQKGDGEAVASFDADWARALAEEDGGLRRSAKFRSVVPQAARSSAVVYLDLDSSWRTTIGTASNSRGFLADTEPLDAVGLSTWREGSTTHLLLKVTTD